MNDTDIGYALEAQREYFESECNKAKREDMTIKITKLTDGLEIITATERVILSMNNRLQESKEFKEDREHLEDIFRGLLRFNRVNSEDMPRIARLLAHMLNNQEGKLPVEKAALDYYNKEARFYSDTNIANRRGR